jgi:hypothetical protein
MAHILNTKFNLFPEPSLTHSYSTSDISQILILLKNNRAKPKIRKIESFQVTAGDNSHHLVKVPPSGLQSLHEAVEDESRIPPGDAAVRRPIAHVLLLVRAHIHAHLLPLLLVISSSFCSMRPPANLTMRAYVQIDKVDQRRMSEDSAIRVFFGAAYI